MNGLSLLTKGHTIRGLEERDREYKLLDKGALPNFSAPKRPIPTTPRSEADENAQAARATAAPASVAEPAPAKQQPLKTALWRRLAGGARDWVLGRIPWRKGSHFRSAGVQTELGLDKVKVIRNDLSEDDLEVVATEEKTTHP
jgi:hypothetical protein